MQKLCHVLKTLLYRGIKQIRSGNRAEEFPQAGNYLARNFQLFPMLDVVFLYINAPHE
jgi:hypothetical protein